jgi:predicted dehydrogenase
VFYVVQRWVGARPVAIRARLEKRRHAALAVEDTATVEPTFPDATAEILLTWAADERRNWAEAHGTGGRLELRDDTLELARGGASERWPCPPALSNGSSHPDWFALVPGQFVADMAAGDGRANLAEASLCVLLEHLARESNPRGGETLKVEPI